MTNEDHRHDGQSPMSIVARRRDRRVGLVPRHRCGSLQSCSTLRRPTRSTVDEKRNFGRLLARLKLDPRQRQYYAYHQCSQKKANETIQCRERYHSFSLASAGHQKKKRYMALVRPTLRRVKIIGERSSSWPRRCSRPGDAHGECYFRGSAQHRTS
jgi:hypothetical protein